MRRPEVRSCWEHVVAGFAWVVKDKSRDQVATRIPFEGRFGDAKLGLLATVLGLGTLIFGALGVFTQLQDALNAIWRVTRRPPRAGGNTCATACFP